MYKSMDELIAAVEGKKSEEFVPTRPVETSTDLFSSVRNIASGSCRTYGPFAVQAVCSGYIPNLQEKKLNLGIRMPQELMTS